MVNKIAEITKVERAKNSLTQEQFGSRLCERLPGVNLSKQAVSNWESGRQVPAYMLLASMTLAYSDWRYDWALACLQAFRPDLWSDRETQVTEPVAGVVGNE